MTHVLHLFTAAEHARETVVPMFLIIKEHDDFLIVVGRPLRSVAHGFIKAGLGTR